MGACASRGFIRRRRRRKKRGSDVITDLSSLDLSIFARGVVSRPAVTTTHADAPTSPYVITIVAMYTFEAQDADELSFQTGDNMVVNEEEWMSRVNWLNAFNLRTRQAGLVPKNYVREQGNDRTASINSRSPRGGEITGAEAMLGHLQRQVDEDGLQVVYLKRDNAVHDFLAYLSQPELDLTRRVIVAFIGEEGVDQGGPSRDLSTSILQYLQHNQTLEGPPGKMCLSHSLGALSRQEYLRLGQLVAFVLCHGGMTCPLFSDSLVNLLCVQPDPTATSSCRQHGGGDDDDDDAVDGGVCVEVDDITDLVFREKLKEIEASEFPCPLAEEVAVEIGFYDVLNAAKKSTFLNVACQYYLYHRCRSEIEQFKAGLNQSGVLGILRKNPEDAKGILCGSRVVAMTANDVYKLFSIAWTGDPESKERQEQEVAAFEFQFFLQDCAEGYCDCTLSDVIYYITGARSIPPGGFKPQPVLRFAHVPYPYVSTCILDLTLPLSPPPHKTLKDVMSLAVSSPEFAIA